MEPRVTAINICFSAIFARLSPIVTCFGSKFPQNMDVGCQKELAEHSYKQERLFGTIYFLLYYVVGYLEVVGELSREREE